MTIIQEIRENQEKGEFVKIPELTLIMIYLISLKNDNLGSKMKDLKFLGIQPSYEL